MIRGSKNVQASGKDYVFLCIQHLKPIFCRHKAGAQLCFMLTVIILHWDDEMCLVLSACLFYTECVDSKLPWS